MEIQRSHYDQLVAIGVPKSYASQIARGVRNPSLKLAVRIFHETGLKLGPLKGVSKADILAAGRLTSEASA